MSSHRLLRVRELLKRQLGEAIRRDISVEQAGLITVNEVEVSPDLRQATVFISVLGTPAQRQQALALLKQHRVRLQDHIARTVVMKFTPQLRFQLDESVQRGNRVLEIIEEIEKSDSNTHES